MVIASLCPPAGGAPACSAIEELERGFLLALTRQPTEVEYDLYIPPGASVPHWAVGLPAVRSRSLLDLPDAAGERQIHAWHDFGHASVAQLSRIREISGQFFPITRVDRPWLRPRGAEADDSPELLECDGAVCLSDWQHRLLAARADDGWSECSFPSHGPIVRHLPPGVTAHRPDPAEKAAARGLLRLPADHVLFLCFCELSPRMSMDVLPLARVMTGVAAEVDRCLLLVCGSDPAGVAESLEGAMARTGLCGATRLWTNSSPQVRSLLLEAADVFVCPQDDPWSEAELDVLQAMGRGLPVVTSAGCPGSSPVVCADAGRHVARYSDPACVRAWRRFACLMPENGESTIAGQEVAVDTRELFACLTELGRDEHLRRRLGENGFQYVRSEHSWESIIAQYKMLWSELRGRLEQARAGCRVGAERVVPDQRAAALRILTRPLPNDAHVRTTSEGRDSLGRAEVAVNEAMAEIIEPGVLKTILERANHGIRISDLVGRLADPTGPACDAWLTARVMLHLAWCVKQGYLALSNGLEDAG